MASVDGKFHASALATAESRDLADENSRDRSQAFVRFFDSSRDLFFQLGVTSNLNVFESPESAVQSRQLLLGEAKLDHFVDLLIVFKITHMSFQKITKIFMPPITQEPRISQPHYSRAHDDEIVPERATAAMSADYEYGRLHCCFTNAPRYLLAYHLARSANRPSIALSGINPLIPLCNPTPNVSVPLKVRGTKYSAIGIFWNPVLS